MFATKAIETDDKVTLYRELVHRSSKGSSAANVTSIATLRITGPRLFTIAYPN